MAEPPPDYYPSLLSVSIVGIPILNNTNWDEWSSVLFDVLAPYEGVVDYLNGGERRQGDCVQLETELLSLIHRTISTDLRVRLRMVTDIYGRSGSQVFKALQERHKIWGLPAQRQAIQDELGSLQVQRGETLDQYIDRVQELYFRVKKAYMTLSKAKEVILFIKGLAKNRGLEHGKAIKILNENSDLTWDVLAAHLKES